MGRKKKFIDKKKSATFQLIARDSSDPIYDDSPGNDRVFVRIDNNPVSVFAGSGKYEDEGEGDSDSIFADAPEDNNDNEADDRVFGTPAAGPARKPLLENVRKEILELGFPDDGYNYLKHLREIKNTGGGSAYYQNPKAKLEELPRDVKAYDASRVRISEGDADSNEKSIFSVASKTVGVRLQKAVDPEVAALLDDSDLSRFASDDEDLEEDFVVQANFAEEGEEDEDEEVDNRLNIVEEKPQNEVDKAGASGQQEVVDSLVFQNGVGNQLVKEGDEIVGDKPRAPRLLDEQFDLLERKEYGTDDDEDDDDYVYVAEEDEFLAEKLKHTLGDNLIDDLELDGKYRAPADLLRDTEGPKSKELLETAADVIHRIVEYAEKYEIESENEDKDMILEQESSDESEMWDCETIVSTYTNCDNHPVKIGAPITRKKKLAETVSNARGATSHVISLQGKQKLPVDFIPPSRKPAAEKVKDVGSNKVEQKKRKPNGQESKEEKKERKAAVKEERREARCVKKEMKELYRSEAQRAQKVAAVACPSSIHLIWGGSSRPDFTCKSTEETETWFIDSFEEWRKAKNLSNFILLGHSFGGYVAAKYALKQPEHVQHLILVGPAGFSSDSDPKYETLIRFRATWKGAILNHLWESNFTPMKVVRDLGPWGPNIVHKYTSARYGTYATGNTLTEEESRLLTDYVYHTLAAKGSGELCLKYIFSFGAFTRMPLLNSASEWKVPTTFIYGFQDWMNYEGAMEARKQMKVPCEIIRVPQAGHFVFIDNPNGFHSAVLHACRKFLSPDPDSDFDSLPEGLTSA